MKMGKKDLFKVLLFFSLFSFFVSCGSKEKGKENTGESASGKTVIETGELAAVNSKAFVLQRYGRFWYEMKVIGIIEHGAIVSEGDSVMQLDPTDIKKYIIDRESQLETELATLQKMYVDQDNKRNELESQAKSEKASFDLKKIELESSRFEPEKTRKIKELEFRQAEITLAKEQKKRKLLDVINRNEIRIQEIRVEQVRNEIKSAYEIIPALTIRTPISGVFQIARNRRTNALVKIGDNLYTGNNLANVPELKWMKVNTQVNENDFLKLQLGQKVNVRLDALPKIVFEGKVAYIGKLCRKKDEKSRQKVFDVEVNILKPDERLKPGMTVSCEFVDSNS
ncbi:MAG: efflux RND transporter periplasmic adaptor subunit [Dysgonamonadaceae bacterium]|jgi:multidrug efflux pump subunit AcrA (membrane-fusion protein)|nr:efflux RND transporter periplasmic adaptor subunit [Dysgonamonadaceae bacterium]